MRLVGTLKSAEGWSKNGCNGRYGFRVLEQFDASLQGLAILSMRTTS